MHPRRSENMTTGRSTPTDDRKTFKKTVSAKDGRQSRCRAAVEIRKQKRDALLKARRDGASTPLTIASSYSSSEDTTTAKIQSAMQAFQDCEKDYRANQEKFFLTVRSIRRLLSVERDPPVDAVIQAGTLYYLGKALKFSENVNLQFEAAWAITNIASTKRTDDVAMYGDLVATLADLLLRGGSPDLREQCAWCLGNIAGHSGEYRRQLLELDSARNGLVQGIMDPEEPSLLKNMVWAAGNLLRESVNVPISKTRCFVKPLINIAQQTLGEMNEDTLDLRSDIFWALTHLADGEPDDGTRAEVLMECGVLPILMQSLDELMAAKATKCLVPLLRCFGYITVGTEEQATKVIEAGFAKRAAELLHFKSKTVEKETTWALSNILAGTPYQIDAVLKQPRLLPTLIDYAQHKHWDNRREALWALTNILEKGTNNHIYNFVHFGGVEALCANLDVADMSLLLKLLDGLERLFVFNNHLGDGNVMYLIEEHEGLSKLEELQRHPNDDVYKKALSIIEQHCDGGEKDFEEDFDENVGPTCHNGTFLFGRGDKFLSNPPAFSFTGAVSSRRFNCNM